MTNNHTFRGRQPPAFAKKGMKVLVLLETEQPICKFPSYRFVRNVVLNHNATITGVETFANQSSLGRFTLRDEGKTIGIGKVTKIRERSDMPAIEELSVKESAEVQA
jgi:peptide chain release factor subunit 3